MEIYIEQVIATRTWKIRQQVLYPNGSLKDVLLENDFEGTHFAASIGDQVVGVISVFKHENAQYQFRKFAVLEEFQRKGLGSKLLKTVFEFCELFKAELLFCYAREQVIPFYIRQGMIQGGDFFEKK